MQLLKRGSASLALASAAIAQSVTVHVVTVGSMNNSLTYSPNNIVAAVGDMVQFQFGPNNHTVTQSTFDSPCEPVSLHSNITGMYSGFMPVSASANTVPTYTVQIANTSPMWLYCSQGRHCQAGMVMVINENTAANATRSLANYAAAAKNAPNNLAPGAGSSNGGGSTMTTSTATAASSPTETNAASASPSFTGAASVVRLSGRDAAGYGGLLAVAVAWLL